MFGGLIFDSDSSGVGDVGSSGNGGDDGSGRDGGSGDDGGEGVCVCVHSKRQTANSFRFLN